MTRMNPITVITGDDALAARLRELTPDVPVTQVEDPRDARAVWLMPPAVVIGADVLREVAALNLHPRAGVYVVTTPDGPPAYIPGAATVPAECVVELAQRDAPEWLAARLRYLASGGDPGTPPNGCEECGAAPGQPCVVANCQGSWH